MPARRLVFCLSATVALSLSGCGGGGSSNSVAPPPPPTDSVTEHSVTASNTDANVSNAFGAHDAFVDTGAAAKGKLFVFLPATMADPQNYGLIAQQGARAGYHVINLAYPNANEVETMCQGSSDPNCEGNVRAETFTGSNVSAETTVSAADSVQNRLAKAIAYLDAHFPSEHWGQFLDTNGVVWSKVRVSGLSQGGGLAAYIAKQKAVDRACFFSSPADWGNGQPAAWINDASATPASRLYGFAHTDDVVVPVTHSVANWTAMGLAGSTVNVDASSSPYQGSHQLLTSLNAGAPGFHSVTVADALTPVQGGTPVYAPVWQYACFD